MPPHQLLDDALQLIFFLLKLKLVIERCWPIRRMPLFKIKGGILLKGHNMADGATAKLDAVAATK